MEKEIRNFSIELRACGDGDKKCRTIQGRAIPFNVFSPNREGFRECVKPEAVEGVIEKSDIMMLYNHDASKGFLARKNRKGKGCLRIDTKEDGVYFEFECKNDNLSNYIYERVANGELDEMSWAFTVDKDEWVKQSDGVYDRTITKFGEIYDLSICDRSYYGLEGACSCKRFAELQEEDAKALEAAQKAEEEARIAKEEQQKAEELAKYHQQILEEYKDYLKADN